MKKIVLIAVVLFISSYVFAQVTELADLSRNYDGINYVWNGNTIKTYEAPLSDVKGSRLLLESYNTPGNITTETKKYSIKNINIDLVNASFISKIKKDSVFVFDNLKGVEILGIKYLKLDNMILEVIYENSKFSFYKDCSKHKSNEVVNKMSRVIIRPSEWKSNNKFYYQKKSGKLILFKPNKKRVLNLFKEDKRQKVKLFVINNSLSYKKPADLSQIFNYYFSI